MDDNQDKVMVALLPTTSDWAQIDIPHMTLVYAGEIKDLQASDQNELAKDAASIAMLSAPVALRVTGLEVFGSDPREKVNVFRLQPSPEIWSMRRSLERWNGSKHDFSPHVTIGPAHQPPAMTPSYIGFDRICVGWGNDYLTFWLRR